MAAAQLNRRRGGGLGAAKPRLDVGPSTDGLGRLGLLRMIGRRSAPRRPAGADSVRCSRSRGDRSAALGRLG